MEKFTSFQFPPTENTVKSAGVNLSYRFGMQTAKPLVSGDGMQPSFGSISDGTERNLFTEDQMGVPTLSSLIIKNKDNETFEFAECIITVNQEKNIVTTALQGRDGTIKEYISKGDYNISIIVGITNFLDVYVPSLTGLGPRAVSASADYPLEAVQNFHKILASEETLIVQSAFLSVFDIQSAVVKSYAIEQETFGNRQSIKIEMLSDYAYEIKLKEENDVKVEK